MVTMAMVRQMKSKLFYLLIVPFLLLSACSNNDIQVSKENALTVCLDEAGIKEKDISNLNINEGEAFTIEFDYNNKHYTYVVGTDGIIQSRKRKALKEEEKIVEEEPKKEENNDIPTEFKNQLKEAALRNVGVSEEDVSDLTVVKNEDNTYTISFQINGASKIKTLADENGELISSFVE